MEGLISIQVVFLFTKTEKTKSEKKTKKTKKTQNYLQKYVFFLKCYYVFSTQGWTNCAPDADRARSDAQNL